jgi:hypothetical protein
MHLVIKKTLVVFVVAGLLLSIFIVPNRSSADEKPGSSNSTWQTDPSVLRSYNGLTGALNYVSFPPSSRGKYGFTASNQKDARSDLNSFDIEFGLVCRYPRCSQWSDFLSLPTNSRWHSCLWGRTYPKL